MHVSLTPELESWINEKVTSGLYQSSSEVIRESLRLLRERDGLRQAMVEELRREIIIGIDELDRGQSKPLTPNLIEEIKRRGRQHLSSQVGNR